jgi:sucrose-6-phosphate hydrolase SacC (GH32 family)
MRNILLAAGIWAAFTACSKKSVSTGSILEVTKDSTGSLVAMNGEDYRPLFHFTPPKNWMNDPNGMVYYKGTYHLFYQYHPFGNKWGPMHWGHTTSTDMFNWKDQPIALAPDAAGTIFSGSAVVDAQNTSGFKTGTEDPLVAIYTLAGTQQHQAIAYSNDAGATWTKYAQNPVLPNAGIADFRDPKVFWHEGRKQWIMSLAVKDKISFYASPNLKSWTLESSFGEKVGAHGGVWECPDLFPIKVAGSNVEKWVLLVSINPGGPNGGSATQYFVGNFDGKTFTPDDTEIRWLDYGTDNYAGVTYSNIAAADGRRILIGWMSNWSYAEQVPTPWRSTMTVPRELSLKQVGQQLVLCSQPVAEWNNYKVSAGEKIIAAPTASVVLENNDLIKSGSYALNFDADMAAAGTVTLSLGNGPEKLLLTIDRQANNITIDRAASGVVDFNPHFGQKVLCPFTPNTNKPTQVQVLVDKTSIEVFVNGGEKVMSVLFFPKYKYTTLKLQAAGNTQAISNFKLQGITKSMLR